MQGNNSRFRATLEDSGQQLQIQGNDNRLNLDLVFLKSFQFALNQTASDWRTIVWKLILHFGQRKEKWLYFFWPQSSALVWSRCSVPQGVWSRCSVLQSCLEKMQTMRMFDVNADAEHDWGECAQFALMHGSWWMDLLSKAAFCLF